jgi:CelD/BcsL family acetyltransferase involved in cellulose biosynthesis
MIPLAEWGRGAFLEDSPAPDAVRSEVSSNPRPPITRIGRIRDSWALTALRPHWNELLRSSAATGPFLTWEWLHTWWRHLGGTAALETVAIWSRDQLIAVAPLMRTRGPLGSFHPFAFLGTGYAGSDYLDIPVRRGHEADALQALVSLFEEQQLVLRLEHLREQSFSAQLADALRSRGWRTLTQPDGVCPFIHLAGHTWESYLATLGPAHRANVRRRLRTLDRQYAVRFEQVASETDRREALSALFRFHRSRFGRAGGSTAFLTPGLRAFHDEVTRLALDRGWLRFYLLRLNDRLAAVMYGFAHNDQFCFYQHGFDDEYRHLSLGLVLMAQSIRAAIDEGLQSFDLLWGTEPYKFLWTHEARGLQRIHVFPPNLGGRVQRAALQMRQRLAPIARRVIPLGDDRGV